MEKDFNLEKLKENILPYYESLGEIYCPYFKEKVAFNSKGIKHIIFKKDKVARIRADQYMRLKNIKFAPKVIKSSYTLQEMRESQQFIPVKSNKRKEKILKKITYYGFVAIIKDHSMRKRFKIIVREVEGGKKHFWSIIPYWKNNKELKLYSGNPEED